MLRAGILYRIRELLLIVLENPTTMDSFASRLPDLSGVPIKILLEAAFVGNWTKLGTGGHLVVTDAGHRLVQEDDPRRRLREEVMTLVEVTQPSWGKLAVQGRKAIERYASKEVIQCLMESGLLVDQDPETVAWWDRISGHVRSDRDSRNMEVGRIGERLSCSLEYKRTGFEPAWVALDYSGLGYDLVSRVSAENECELYIEVKTSSLAWDDAVLHLTRWEWMTLQNSQYATFHLWSIQDPNLRHAEVSPSEMTRHIPTDMGGGEWQEVSIPFREWEPKAYQDSCRED